MRGVHTVVATWAVSLDCECPHCYRDVDIFADDWGDRNIHVGESRKGVKVDCPYCDKEFNADLEY